jgi:hypothetical protein
MGEEPSLEDKVVSIIDKCTSDVAVPLLEPEKMMHLFFDSEYKDGIIRGGKGIFLSHLDSRKILMKYVDLRSMNIIDETTISMTSNGLFPIFVGSEISGVVPLRITQSSDKTTIERLNRFDSAPLWSMTYEGIITPIFKKFAQHSGWHTKFHFPNLFLDKDKYSCRTDVLSYKIISSNNGQELARTSTPLDGFNNSYTFDFDEREFIYLDPQGVLHGKYIKDSPGNLNTPSGWSFPLGNINPSYFDIAISERNLVVRPDHERLYRLYPTTGKVLSEKKLTSMNACRIHLMNSYYILSHDNHLVFYNFSSDNPVFSTDMHRWFLNYETYQNHFLGLRYSRNLKGSVVKGNFDIIAISPKAKKSINLATLKNPFPNKKYASFFDDHDPTSFYLLSQDGMLSKYKIPYNECLKELCH